MAYEIQPPQAGPWQSSSEDQRSSGSGGPWGFAAHYNPYAPPTPAGSGGALRPIAPTQLRLASPGQRLLAKLIDRVLLGLAIAPGVIVQLVWDTGLGVVLWTLGLVAIAVFQWAMTATSGQTLGKRWVGLRMVSDKGGPVGFARGVLLRTWVMWLGSALAGGLALVLNPFFVFAKNRKAIHDHLAGTLVIEADTPGDPYAHD